MIVIGKIRGDRGNMVQQLKPEQVSQVGGGFVGLPSLGLMMLGAAVGTYFDITRRRGAMTEFRGAHGDRVYRYNGRSWLSLGLCVLGCVVGEVLFC